MIKLLVSRVLNDIAITERDDRRLDISSVPVAALEHEHVRFHDEPESQRRRLTNVHTALYKDNVVLRVGLVNDFGVISGVYEALGRGLELAGAQNVLAVNKRSILLDDVGRATPSSNSLRFRV